MRLASRLDRVPPYLFVEISRKIAEKKAQGVEVISFGIGDPDLPTPDNVISRLQKTALDAPNHRYPETDGLPELRRAAADWYQRRFGIALDPDSEVLSLIGAKEGIGHAGFCFLDPGDVALVPDPGYPVYAIGTWFAGGECRWMPLLEENGWLPDLDAIPAEVARRAKVMWLNYPNNPTGAVAELDYFERVVEFAKRNDIAVAHDACYTEVAYDGYKPPSFLQAPGAMDVGIEFHSLSKSYNMTGWRIGMAVGNAELIRGADGGQVEPGLRGPTGYPAHGHRGAEDGPAVHGRAQRHLSATPGPGCPGAAWHRPPDGDPEGEPLRLGARPRGLHLGAVHGDPTGGEGRRGLAGPGVRRARRGLYPAVTDHLGRGVGEGPRADSLAEHSHGLVKEGAASQGLWSRPGAALSGCSSSASSKRGAAARGRLRTPWTNWPSWRVARAPRWWAP